MIATSRIHGVARLRAAFSANLREAMLHKNMSQSDLARAVWKEERSDKNGYAQPVGKDRISAYINGRVLPTEETLDKIAKALDTTKEKLLGEWLTSSGHNPSNAESPQDLVIRITPHGTVTVIDFKITVQPSAVFDVMNAFNVHVKEPYALERVKDDPVKNPENTINA